MNRPNPRFLADCQSLVQTVGDPFTSTNAAHRQPGQPLWLRAASKTPGPGLLGVLGALAAFALLLAFSNVVSEGVQQGALRRSTLAAQAAPAWRCDTTEQKLLLRCVAGADNRLGRTDTPRMAVSLDKPANLALTMR